MSATNEQIIEAIETILAAHAELALTSYLEPGEIDSPASIGVVDGDRIRPATDIRNNGVQLDVSVLVPLDEAAADFAAERQAGHATAQTIFAAVRAAIESTYTPWRKAWLVPGPSFALVRPQPHVLCAGVSATFGFAL